MIVNEMGYMKGWETGERSGDVLFHDPATSILIDYDYDIGEETHSQTSTANETPTF